MVVGCGMVKASSQEQGADGYSEGDGLTSRAELSSDPSSYVILNCYRDEVRRRVVESRRV